MNHIYSYTRKQAIADGFQVEVTETAREAGIMLPVFLNRTVFDRYVAISEEVKEGRCGSHQDESGRLWDILWMLRFAIKKSQVDGSRMSFALYVRNDNNQAKLIKLVAVCGALDIDDPQPSITVMLPYED